MYLESIIKKNELKYIYLYKVNIKQITYASF